MPEQFHLERELLERRRSDDPDGFVFALIEAVEAAYHHQFVSTGRFYCCRCRMIDRHKEWCPGSWFSWDTMPL